MQEVTTYEIEYLMSPHLTYKNECDRVRNLLERVGFLDTAPYTNEVCLELIDFDRTEVSQYEESTRLEAGHIALKAAATGGPIDDDSLSDIRYFVEAAQAELLEV